MAVGHAISACGTWHVWCLCSYQREASVTDSAIAPARLAPTKVPHVFVTVADNRGWDIYVELDGRRVTSEPCTDWHRVERHRARLEAEFRQEAANHNVRPAAVH